MKYVVVAARPRVPRTRSARSLGRALQVPPVAARSTRSTRSREYGARARPRARRLAPAALQPVEPRRRRLRARPDALPPEAAMITVVIAHPRPIENVLTAVLEWLHGSIGPPVGVVDRRPHADGPDRDRPADGQADPVDAAAAGARPGAEGDPAEVQGRQAAHERRGHEVLPGEQGQPGRLVSPGPPPDPGLHRALLRPARTSRRRSSRTTRTRASAS